VISQKKRKRNHRSEKNIWLRKIIKFALIMRWGKENRELYNEMRCGREVTYYYLLVRSPQ
jgi:hypothetical protein